MTTMLWLQTGSCGGDTMSILCADRPSFADLFDVYQLELLWMPTLSAPASFAPAAPLPVGSQSLPDFQAQSGFQRLQDVVDAVLADQQPLDILCVEGSIITAPDGTGMFDPYQDRSKMSLIEDLAQKARYVLAMGTCAAYGGIHAAPPNPAECIGLQFTKEEQGGLLPPQWRSAAGYPVINLAGCPVHPNTMTKTLSMIAAGFLLQLDQLNRPREFFSTLVHQGCTRNEYHEYDVEDTEFGDNGCMFFNLGCKGPVTQATCNTDLWNGRSSKTRAGVPCFGCTAPNFPQDEDMFATEKLGPIPVQLPDGVERANYMAYKNLAKAAAPARVKNRKMEP